MKIVIPGGSGQVGTILARYFHARGDEVVILSRKKSVVSTPWRVVQWDGRTQGAWSKELDGCDVVINLTGRSVNCRYTKKNREEILQSRVMSVAAVEAAIARAKVPPRIWLQAGTATIYAHRYDAPNDEATGLLGGNEADVPDTWKFSIDVALAWEQAFHDADTPHTRKVLLRSAMTMSPDPGGVLDTLLGLVRLGLGGREGNGKQYVSWIHHDDFIRALVFLMEHEEISGAVNLASPHPLPNDEFMREIRTAAGVRIGLPAAEWMLEIGAIFLQTETELILKSRRVIPGRLLDYGFQFRYPLWKDAVKNLLEDRDHYLRKAEVILSHDSERWSVSKNYRGTWAGSVVSNCAKETICSHKHSLKQLITLATHGPLLHPLLFRLWE